MACHVVTFVKVFIVLSWLVMLSRLSRYLSCCRGVFCLLMLSWYFSCCQGFLSRVVVVIMLSRVVMGCPVSCCYGLFHVVMTYYVFPCGLF